MLSSDFSPRNRDLLQDDLKSLHQWSETWNLNFHGKKCVALKFFTTTTAKENSIQRVLPKPPNNKVRLYTKRFRYSGERRFEMVPAHHHHLW